MKKTVRKLLLVLLSAVLLLSLVFLGRDFLNYREGDAIYQEAAENFQKKSPPPQQEQEEPAPPDGPGIEIDFEKLWAVNEDVIAWIYAPDTAINYPVLRGVDNERYLDTTYDERSSSFGSIFLDMANAEDFSDAHSIVYGHNMKNGSMFGGLKRYRNQAYFDQHPDVYLIFPDGWVKYRPFSAHTTTTTGGVFLRSFADETEQSRWLELVQRLSNVKSELRPTVEDRVITLATCTSVRLNDRFVLHAMLVEDKREAPRTDGDLSIPTESAAAPPP